MAQETVTEYETVEKQKTRTLCDNCNRTEEEEDILTVAINPQEKVRETQNLELVRTYENELEAERFIRDKSTPTSTTTIDGQEVYGVGMNYNTKTVNMNASATADLCASCVFDLFGIEIPEGEEVEDISLGETRVNIDTTKEVTTVWPQIPEWSSTFSHDWKTSTIGWPILFIFSVMDFIFKNSLPTEEDKERTKGYVGGSLGAIIWTGIVLTALYLTSFIVLAV